MGRSQETWNKKEREKKKRQKKKEKEERRLEKKSNAENNDTSLDAMMAYIDENGNLSDTPPDPKKMEKIKAEDIEIGIPRKEDQEEESKERKGRISFFNHNKGFGFIRDDLSRESIFVHVSNTLEPVNEMDQVVFEIERGDKGFVAVKVKRVQ